MLPTVEEQYRAPFSLGSTLAFQIAFTQDRDENFKVKPWMGTLCNAAHIFPMTISFCPARILAVRPPPVVRQRMVDTLDPQGKALSDRRFSMPCHVRKSEQ